VRPISRTSPSTCGKIQ